MKVVAARSVLKVEVGATEKEVRMAYRQEAKLWHPDRHMHSTELRIAGEKQMRLINTALEVLLTHGTHDQSSERFQSATPSENGNERAEYEGDRNENVYQAREDQFAHRQARAAFFGAFVGTIFTCTVFVAGFSGFIA